MATVIMDKTGDLGAHEHRGAMVELRRGGRVYGLTTASYTAVYEALAALDSAGYTIGSQPDATNYGYDLVLTDRLLESDRADDNTSLKVQLVYNHFQNDEQTLDDSNSVTVKIKTSLVQETLSKYPADYGGATATETQKALRNQDIVLKHAYVKTTTYVDDAGATQTIAPTGDVNFDGETHWTTGEVSVFKVQTICTITGIHRVGNVWGTDLQDYFIRKVNDKVWLGKAAGTWLCVNAEYELFNLSEGQPNNWKAKFFLEFQNDPDGWQPTAKFPDQRYGTPVAGLVDGEGKRTLSGYYQPCDYDKYFNIMG